MKVAFIVATGADDPLYQPSEGAVASACSRCGAGVMLDRKSQALMPVPVYCLRCALMQPRIPWRRA